MVMRLEYPNEDERSYAIRANTLRKAKKNKPKSKRKTKKKDCGCDS